MSVVRPISDPVGGEQVVGIWPTMAMQVDAAWRRRLNLFAGRSLSDTAMQLEQEHRAGHLALAGQRLSPGVIRGLEVGMEVTPDEEIFLHVAPGFGLTASGEDVRVPRTARIRPGDLWVYLSAAAGEAAVERIRLPERALLASRLAALPLRAPAVRLPQLTVAASAPMHPPLPPPPHFRGPLRELREGGTPLPDVFVLLLEPVVAELLGEAPGRDPCEADPRDDAFADWQIADGCRLVLYAWPWPEWLPPAGPTRRNELANRIFQMEAALGPGEVHPWELKGLPLAVLGFDAGAGGGLEFIDGYAVVRDGGKPRPRTPLVEGVGNPFLWQARIKQFAEQLAEVDWASAQPAEVFPSIRYLPPAGLLPRAALDLVSMRSRAFPPAWLVEAAPVPLEQLDAALEASAGLEPFDVALPDRVRVLVPVPQTLYEPRLLRQEEVDPEFEEKLEEFTSDRREWLMRREDVRRKAEALVDAIEGERPAFPAPEEDPERLEEETVDGESIPLGPRVHHSGTAGGLHEHFFSGASLPLVPGEGDELYAEVFTYENDMPMELMLHWFDGAGWEHRAFWGENQINVGTTGTASRFRVGLVPEAGGWATLTVSAAAVGLVGVPVSGMGFSVFGGRALWGRAGLVGAETTDWVDGGLPEGAAPVRGMGEPWRWVRLDYTYDLDRAEEQYDTEVLPDGIRVSTRRRRLREELLARSLHAEEMAKFDSLGLREFIRYLDKRIRGANDKIDFGFLRVQADMYRLRQLMLGETAATRLATSPALASIIKGESALTVRENLMKYLDTVKIPLAQAPAPAAAAFAPTAEVVQPAGQIPTQPTGAEVEPILARSTFSFGGISVLQPVSAISPTLSPISSISAISPVTAISPTLSKTSLTQVALQESLAISPLLGATRPALKSEVLLRAPIVGESFDFRTVTVGERLTDPPANEARSFTVLTKYEVTRGLAELEINISAVHAVGLLKPKTNADGQELDEVETHARTGLPVRVSRPFAELTPARLDRLILGEPHPANGDEAAFFSAGVSLLDSTIATLRNVEGRLEEYRGALDACRDALNDLTDRAGETDRRLKTIADELAEARHDVAVARALLADEEERVEGINERRARIVRDHVLFLAYHRPRLAHADLEAPARGLYPAFVQTDAPACDAGGAEPPAELRAMVELLRESPLRWFHFRHRLLDLLDRPELLVGTMQGARQRALLKPAAATMLEEGSGRTGTLLTKSLQRTLGAQQVVVSGFRAQMAQADLSRVSQASWKVLRHQSEQLLSLGDLIDAAHGRTGVDRLATRELDDILHVATCLYARFGDVLPALRLDWAERLSEHDETVDLRNLYSLPEWGRVDYLQRREMQSLVDWLHTRIEPGQSDGRALMNEVVRVCLLLASHAPVRQIIAGSVPRQATIRVGGTLELAVDLARVRVGMPVLVYDQQARPVRAVIEDLATGVAVGRVVQAATTTVTIPQGARAQFGEATRVGAPARASGRTLGR